MTGRCNVYVEEDTMMVEVELPGVVAHDVRLTLLERHIEVQGHWAQLEASLYARRERPTGDFRRSIPLPRPIDLEASLEPDFNFDLGVLRIRLALRKSPQHQRPPLSGPPAGLRVVRYRAPEAPSAPPSLPEPKLPIETL